MNFQTKIKEWAFTALLVALIYALAYLGVDVLNLVTDFIDGSTLWCMLFLFSYVLMFRLGGIFMGFTAAFCTDNEAEKLAAEMSPDADAKFSWSDLLEPFLDTDVPRCRAEALNRLRSFGLKDWQIRGLRGWMGIGFPILIADEWLEYSYADVTTRWMVTIVLDATLAGGIWFFSPDLGIFLAIVWAVELGLLAGLIYLNKRLA